MKNRSAHNRALASNFVAAAATAVYALSTLSACTDAMLVMAPMKVDIHGTYCPSNSSVLNVPLRIMLIIDTSGSMEDNDPKDGRMKAAEQLINSFSPEADVKFSLVIFDDFATPATVDASGNGVFTRDPGILAGALSMLTREDGFTNYLGALGDATLIIRNDLKEIAKEIAEKEAAGEETEAMSPYYFVVFLSDGVPRVKNQGLQDESNILFEVQDLMSVPEPALGITLHTAFLGMDGVGDPGQIDMAMKLLKKMADTGQGKFANFSDGEEIDFRLFEFNIVRLFDAKRFLAYNRNAALGPKGVEADTDGDGLSDAHEIRLGSDPLLLDSDEDNMKDGFEIEAGQRPVYQDPFCVNKPLDDYDNDGLTDCEERLRGFDPDRFDSDLDLFPDLFELHSGANPADHSDIELDMDFDGRLTAQELVERTDPKRAERPGEYNEFAYIVDHHRWEDWTTDGLLQRVCYDFDVRNISIVPLTDNRYNEVVFEFIESPLDDPEHEFHLRRNVLRVDHRKLVPNSAIRLGELEFETISTQKIDLMDDEDD